ncbi:FHA domain-containing protein [Paludisphaera sp.]|uniref:FHA domain-containing protein n=1 Tax=Paludisphaera sp. TaxID=2017432 RepID=UPI00301DD514
MKSFLESCRLPGPLQLVVEAGGESDVGVRVLHQPFALIGRDPRADVPLEHRLVSRRHAYLQVVEGHAFWIDLESRLGTLGGDRPRKHGWLTPEEPMRIGPYELRLGASPRAGGEGGRPPESTPLVSRSYGASAWPEVGLEFLNGPSRSAVWPMNRVVSLIGSAAGCKFRLADPSVSPFHCSLVRTAAGLWVVDLLGGVEVNNAAVRFALLAEGDVLEVGRYKVRIRSRDSATASAAVPADLRPSAPAAEGRSLALALAPEPGHGDILPLVREDDPGRGRGLAVPTVSVLPAEISGAASDPVAVLVPLMNQFGLMQQQMMDQFQSAMGMLVEMFGSLQREQMDLIRQELDQLREVTREVQDLKAELASYAKEREEARASGAATAAPTPAVAPPVSPVTPPPSPDPRPRPSPMPPPPSRSPDPEANNAGARADAAKEVPAPSVAPAADAETRGPARPGARPRPRVERPSPAANEADVMLWLNQRIGALQEERESRWRKILKLLPGSS